MRRLTQRRDNRKTTSDTASPPCYFAEIAGLRLPGSCRTHRLRGFLHGLERDKPACMILHLYPALQYVVSGVPAQKSSDGRLAAVKG